VSASTTPIPEGIAPSTDRSDSGPFDGAIERPRVSMLYQLGLLIVAAAMVLLPIIYVALIGGLGFALYYHAANNTWIVTEGPVRGRAKALAVIAYAAPFLIGVVLILFMIKPLFARRGRELSPLAIDRQQQPRLFDFIERLCDAIGAPMPGKVQVTCDVNASASFRRGWLSMFGNDLTLTIGLPLVAGLTLRQFAGVLAHELGHFSQGLAMRVSYVIRGVNGWFARVVYERDAWDEYLLAAAEVEDARITIFVQLTRLFVWLTRRVLWVLMMVGHGISCFLMRQMEYDADRYEAGVSGSEAFVETTRTFPLLNAAAAGAYADLRLAWSERRLADNLPALILANEAQMPAQVRGQIAKAIEEGRTGWFDTHPSDRDRVRSVRKRPTPGILRVDGPAESLWNGFETVCKNISFVHYRDMIGNAVQRESLVPTERLVRRHGRMADEFAVLNRYLVVPLSIARPLTLDQYELTPVKDVAKKIATLEEAHRRIGAAAPKVLKAVHRFDEADTARIEAMQAQTLCRAKVKFNPKDFNVARASEDAAEKKESDALAAQREAAGVLDAYDAVIRTRLTGALRLLAAPAVAAKVERAGELRREAVRLLRSWSRLAAAMPSFQELRRQFPSLAILMSLLDSANENTSLAAVIRTRTATIHQALTNMRSVLADAPYPFEYADGEITLSQYVVEHIAPERNPPAVCMSAKAVAERFLSLYPRVLGRLAAIAEQVEASLGLAPHQIIAASQEAS